MSEKTKQQNGIRIDLMRDSQISDMGKTEKIRYIIDHVRDGCIVVLESGLEPSEHSLLIEKTMAEIDQDSFTGVEVESYPENTTDSDTGLLGRVLNRNKSNTPKKNLTVIGPADRMETLHKDETHISALLNP